MSLQFIHLKCHTEFSLVDGLVRVDDLVSQCKQQQMPAVAVTDFCNLFALVKFYKKALAAGIKPVVGAEVVINEGESTYRVTLLCQNNQGYLNLTKLISESYLHGQKRTGEPEIQWQWLQEKNAGLIVLSGGRFGNVGQALLNQDVKLAQSLARRWADVFPDRYYIELVRTKRAREKDYLHAAIKLAQVLKLPVVATNDVRFIQADDFQAHEARVCIHAGYMLDDTKRPKEYSHEQYFKSQDEMLSLFEDIPEALQNTVLIAQRCNVSLSLGKAYLPNFPVPEGISLTDFLRQESEKGLKEHWQFITSEEYTYQDYQNRLDFELDVINKMGFPGYFLIVADFIRWAKENGIPVGPGRGSGAGSLVAYCLGITMLDPLENHLLFERFLNPERVSMPDFDVDFCMDKRDDVIDYVARRYGHDAVSQIITYGTMAAKAVVRDVGRVLGYPYGLVDKIAKLIPFEIGITLDKALEQEERLSQRYETEEEVSILIDLAKKLEGVTRNAGKHAGGVVIAPSKLTDFTALYCESSGEHPVTQFDKDDVEAVGLVKFDFLGLRTLTIIDWALKAINKRLLSEGKDPVTIDKIPLNDKQSFDLLKACSTTAVFQLESRGMKELIRRLQPDTFEEITALVALFRPGPLQSGMVDDFIDRKHGRAQTDYPHPELEPILDTTYGVILYQEQVMKIAQVLANYTLGGADILRRAMGKKKPEEMAKQREVFRKGAVARDVDEKVAMRVFDLMEKFAGYGFNKSHSAAYALVAYQTAYLKAHYPAEFMAAVLSSDMDNTDKVVGFLGECKNMGLKVLKVNVNVGRYMFYVNAKGEIEYGLGAIKGVGQAACEHIVEDREENGLYESLFDFCHRLDMRKISRRGLEPLIKSGSFDGFEKSRAVLIGSVDKAIQVADQLQRDLDNGQSDMFALPDENQTKNVEYVKVPNWTMSVKLQGEKDTLGFYLSGHPFNIYVSELKKMNVISMERLPGYVKRKAKIAGILLGQRAIVTKSGRKMGILTIEDNTGKCEVTLFNRIYAEVVDKLIPDELFVFQGKVETDDYSGGVRMIADSVTSLVEMRSVNVKRLLLRMHDSSQVEELLAQLPLILTPFCGGRCAVTISYKNDNASADIQLGKKWMIRPETELINQLRNCCGEDCVELQYA